MSLPPDIQAFLDRYGDDQQPKRDTGSRDHAASSKNWEFYAEVSVGRDEEPRKCMPDKLTISELHKECGVAIRHNIINTDQLFSWWGKYRILEDKHGYIQVSKRSVMRYLKAHLIRYSGFSRSASMVSSLLAESRDFGRRLS